MRHLVIAAVLVGAVAAPAAADEPVLAPIAHGQPKPRLVPAAPNAKAVAITATVVTGALFATTVVAYQKRENLIHELERDNWRKADFDLNAQRSRDEETWRDRMLMFGAATIVSGAITGYLWTRTEPRYESVIVAPNQHGASVSFAKTF